MCTITAGWHLNHINYHVRRKFTFAIDYTAESNRRSQRWRSMMFTFGCVIYLHKSESTIFNAVDVKSTKKISYILIPKFRQKKNRNIQLTGNYVLIITNKEKETYFLSLCLAQPTLQNENSGSQRWWSTIFTFGSVIFSHESSFGQFSCSECTGANKPSKF